jgi:hypothetical protein
VKSTSPSRSAVLRRTSGTGCGDTLEKISGGWVMRGFVFAAAIAAGLLIISPAHASSWKPEAIAASGDGEIISASTTKVCTSYGQCHGRRYARGRQPVSFHGCGLCNLDANADTQSSFERPHFYGPRRTRWLPATLRHRGLLQEIFCRNAKPERDSADADEIGRAHV